MKLILSALLAPSLALLALVPAAAADNEATDTVGQTDTGDTAKESIVVEGEKDKAEKKVCRREIPLGSIRSVKVCRTVADGAEQRTQDDLQRMREDMARQQQTSGLRQ